MAPLMQAAEDEGGWQTGWLAGFLRLFRLAHGDSQCSIAVSQEQHKFLAGFILLSEMVT